MRRLTVKQAAKLARVHPITIHRWLALGVLPDRRIPGTKKHIIHDTDITNPQPTELRAA